MPRWPNGHVKATPEERAARDRARRATPEYKEWKRVNRQGAEAKAKAAAHSRKWRAEHPERTLELNRKSREKHGAKWRANRRARYASDANLRLQKLLYRYGISTADYAAILGQQGGRCEICHREPSGGKRGRLYVDHCHETGIVRALLCKQCNAAIGLAGEDGARLERMAAYVRKWREVRLARVS